MSDRDELLREWKKFHDEETACKEKLEELKKKKASIVDKVKDMLDSKSFLFEGWWYNIKKTRKGTSYFSLSKKKPGSWLKKD